MNYHHDLIVKNIIIIAIIIPGMWTCELKSGDEQASAEVELSVAMEPEVFPSFFFHQGFKLFGKDIRTLFLSQFAVKENQGVELKHLKSIHRSSETRKVFIFKINMFITEILLGGLDRWIYFWVHRQAGKI